MKKETKFIRRKNKITDVENNTTQSFPSINAAKRESRKLQPRSGDGTVRVER